MPEPTAPTPPSPRPSPATEPSESAEAGGRSWESSRRRYEAFQRARRADAAWARRSLIDATTTADKTRRSRGAGALFRAFWAFTPGHRPAIALAVVTVTLTTVVALALPASTKFVIDFALADSPGPAGIPDAARSLLAIPTTREGVLWWVGVATILIAMLSVALGITGRWQMTRVTKRLQAHLRRRAFEHASRLPLHRIQRHKSGGMASLLREDAGSAGELLFSALYNPWRAVVQFVGTLLILAWVDYRLVLGGLLLLPLVWYTHKTWIGRIRPLFRDAKQARMAIDASTTEVFGGMRVVRGFGRERSEAGRFSRGQHYFTRLEVLTWWWSRGVDIAWSLLIPVASAALMVFGGRAVLRGELTIGDLMMFSTYLLMLLGPLETLSNTATTVQGNLASLDRVLDLLAEPQEFAGQRTGLTLARADIKGRLELTDVSYAYPASSDPNPVVRGVSLTIPAGTTLALVGASGSGKTTLCNLIARFDDPTHGRITLDGRDLREIDVDSYRAHLGIVEQDVFLFDGTIAENIAYARRDTPFARVRDAAQAANADEFIQRLPKGYDTLIGERGVRLSGGQKQRLAIARALLADPAILILDEATSSLDTISERLIQGSLARLMKGRTCVVIAHRLSTIRHADRIAVIDQGRVIEVGTHEQLLAAGGRYAFLLRLQLGEQAAGLDTPA